MSASQGYTFGPYRFDSTEGLLTRDGQPVRVSAKALALLAVLLSRAGFLVSNAELIADAWPNAAAGEDQLAPAMAALRAALQDDRGERYIETVPRTGYRFIAPVSQTKLDAVWLDPAAPAAADGRASLSIGWAAAGVVLIAAAIAAALFFGPGGSAPPNGNGAVSSLIVVPFQTAGAAGDQSYLGLGMADALATRLGAVDRLRVPPTAAIQPREDAFDAGRRLAVDAVLTGFIQRDGGRVRVTAELSQVGDHRQLWNAKFDDQFTDIFDVQDAIAERITRSLLRDVSSGQRAALHRRETDNTEAYDRYLRGREQWSRRTIESTQAAIQSYQEAIALDPSFAAAYAGLADAYVGNASGMPPATRYPLARAAIDKALAINPDLADAQVALGYLLYRAEWKFAESEAALRKASMLDPKNNLAHHHLGQVYKLLGEWPEALEQFRTAHALNPNHPRTHVDIAFVLLLMGRVPEARAIVEDGLKHAGDSAELHEQLASVLLAEGKADESMEAHLQARLMGGRSFEEIDQLRQAYRAGGRAGELRKENALIMANLRAETDTPGRGVASVLTDNSAQLRDASETLRWLAEAFRRQEEEPLALNLPEFDFLRSDPRFVALYRRVFPTQQPPATPIARR